MSWGSCISAASHCQSAALRSDRRRVNHPGAEFQYQELNPPQSLRTYQDKVI